MFDKLSELFTDEFKHQGLISVLSTVGMISEMWKEKYLKDKDAKNAVIDCICEIFQSYKDQPPQE